MIYKRITSLAIVNQAIRKFGLTMQSKSDAIEDIGMTMEEIGYHTGFVNKYGKLEVENFTIPEPVDFKSINYFLLPNGEVLSKKGTKLKEVCSPVYSDAITELHLMLSARNELLNPCESVNTLGLLETGQDQAEFIHEALHDMDHKITNRLSLIRPNDLYYTKDYYYEESVNCWKTNYDGPVIIFYKAFPVDEQGYPLIPDEIKYKNAIMWGILLGMMNRGYKHPVFEYKDVYSQYMSWVGKASNEGVKFNREQAESFKQGWTSIQNRPNYYSNGD